MATDSDQVGFKTLFLNTSVDVITLGLVRGQGGWQEALRCPLGGITCRKPIMEVIWGQPNKRLSMPQGFPLKMDTTPVLSKDPFVFVFIPPLSFRMGQQGQNRKTRNLAVSNHFLSFCYMPGALHINLTE